MRSRALLRSEEVDSFVEREAMTRVQLCVVQNVARTGDARPCYGFPEDRYRVSASGGNVSGLDTPVTCFLKRGNVPTWFCYF